MGLCCGTASPDVCLALSHHILRLCCGGWWWCLMPPFWGGHHRLESMAIETIVLTAASRVFPGMCGLACGSYRRGQPSSGDVDVILTHPDGALKPLAPILRTLHDIHFLTDDLTRGGGAGVPAAAVAHARRLGHADDRDREGYSYMGVCHMPRLPWRQARQLFIGWYKCVTPRPGAVPTELLHGILPTEGSHHHGRDECGDSPGGGRWLRRRDARTSARPCYLSWLPHHILWDIVMHRCGGTARRIDIKSYTKSEFAFALLYFTGSGMLSRVTC